MDAASVAFALRGRGGSRQQLELEAELPDDIPMESDDDSDCSDHCELVTALLYLFGWGFLSLPNMVWLAKMCYLLGQEHF